jgi:phage FluMu protein Com
MALGYIKCPQCKEINPLYTPYPRCYDCLHVQYIDPTKEEKEVKVKVEEMVKYLLPTGTPSCQYPEASISSRGNDCYG